MSGSPRPGVPSPPHPSDALISRQLGIIDRLLSHPGGDTPPELRADIDRLKRDMDRALSNEIDAALFAPVAPLLTPDGDVSAEVTP